MHGNISALTADSKPKLLSSVGIAQKSENEIPAIEEFLKLCQSEEPVEILLKEIDLKTNPRDAAMKLSKFLDHYLSLGNWEAAEALFKNFISDNAKKPTVVNHRLFNSMFKGFSELGVVKNDTGYLSKQKVYWDLSERIHNRVFNECVIATLKLASVLASRNVKFNSHELEFLNETVLPYLVRLKIENGFQIQNKRILDSLRSNEQINFPKEL